MISQKTKNIINDEGWGQGTILIGRRISAPGVWDESIIMISYLSDQTLLTVTLADHDSDDDDWYHPGNEESCALEHRPWRLATESDLNSAGLLSENDLETIKVGGLAWYAQQQIRDRLRRGSLRGSERPLRLSDPQAGPSAIDGSNSEPTAPLTPRLATALAHVCEALHIRDPAVKLDVELLDSVDSERAIGEVVLLGGRYFIGFDDAGALVIDDGVDIGDPSVGLFGAWKPAGCERPVTTGEVANLIADALQQLADDARVEL